MFLVQRPFRDFNSFRVRIFISHMYITHTQQLTFQNCNCKVGNPFSIFPAVRFQAELEGEKLGRHMLPEAHLDLVSVLISRYWLYTRGISVDEKEAVHARWVQGVHIEQFAGLVWFATHWEAGHLVGNHSSTSYRDNKEFGWIYWLVSFKKRCIKWRQISKGPNDFGDLISWDVELWLVQHFIILFPCVCFFSLVLSFVVPLPRFLGWSVCEAWTSINPGFCQTSQT